VTNKERELYIAYRDAPVGSDAERTAWCAYVKVSDRNARQRARRASPEQKAKEVLANRKSRLRKRLKDSGFSIPSPTAPSGRCYRLECFCNKDLAEKGYRL
jgi:hypothetical protein